VQHHNDFWASNEAASREEKLPQRMSWLLTLYIFQRYVPSICSAALLTPPCAIPQGKRYPAGKPYAQGYIEKFLPVRRRNRDE
jgi:hypothetical protein